MRISPLVLLCFVLLVGGSCSSPADTTTQDQQKTNKIRVLMVSADRIHPYFPLQANQVEFIEVPDHKLLWDAVTRQEDYENKALNIELTKGELITKSRLIEPFFGPAGTPREEFIKGKVVVSVNMLFAPTAKGPIRPGNIVDVYALFLTDQPQESEEVYGYKCELVGSQVRVLSIDSPRLQKVRVTEFPFPGSSTISLLVDPNEQQTEALILAAKRDKLLFAVKK